VKRRRFRRTTDATHSYALAANLLFDKQQTEGVSEIYSKVGDGQYEGVSY
jgi:hypothetical protein